MGSNDNGVSPIFRDIPGYLLPCVAGKNVTIHMKYVIFSLAKIFLYLLFHKVNQGIVFTLVATVIGNVLLS